MHGLGTVQNCNMIDNPNLVLQTSPGVLPAPPIDSAPAPIAPARAAIVTRAGLINAGSNATLATLFFITAMPAAGHYRVGAADFIWSVGAALMGLFSLVRMPPRTSMVNVRSIAATGGMMLLPALIKWAPPATGWCYRAGVALELAGMTFTQVARVYLGRSFGLFPANRGIVSRGPFRLMRHPIYVGWFLLSLGYSMTYPSARNLLVIAAILPFMLWRIVQEEQLLSDDPEYREYCERVRYRLIPGIV